MNKKKPVSTHLKFAVISTDIICFKIKDNKLFTLLGKVQHNPHYPNNWAAIGGLIREEETAEDAADRLMNDKAGIKDFYKEQLYTFSEVDRDPRNRVISIAYIGIVQNNNSSGLEMGEGSVETMWCSIDKLPKLAYDHDTMVTVAVDRLRSRLEYTNIAQYFLPEQFTFSELQKVYEIMLGKGMDKRNFRKKILAAGILKDTKLTRKEGVMRPAALFKFVSKEIKVVDIL